MKYSGYLVGAAMAAVANAHTTLWNLYENDVDLGVGNTAGGYIRFPPNNNPIKDITSKDMTCNVANTPNTLTKTVTAGSKLTFEWHHDSNSASDDIIAASHKGPVMVYIAPTSSNGAGDVWVKIAEDGYDASTKLWAVDKLIANKGKHSFTLPAALANGDYLLRGEIIALHESDTAYSANPARGSQFYMECVQVTVTGGGSTVLPAGVAIPGAYAYTDPGVVFNLYGSYTSYTIPGPAVWTAAGGSASAPAATSAKAVVVSSSAAVVKASSSAAVVATSAAAPVVTPVAETTEVAAAPVATPVAETTEVAAAPVVTSAPVASVTKSACKAKTTTVAPVPVATKSACAAKPVATTLQTLIRSSTAASAPASTDAAGSVALYGRCGGIGYTGPTTCASGTCKVSSEWYSQCI